MNLREGETRVKFYARGAGCESVDQALTAGLHLPNKSSAQIKDPAVFGNFFFDGDLPQAEAWALMIAGREHKQPVTITFTVREENFSAVGGRIWVAKIGSILISRGKQGYPFNRADTFSELQDGQACIAINAMQPKDLIALEAQIGVFDARSDRFVYRRVTLQDLKK